MSTAIKHDYTFNGLVEYVKDVKNYPAKALKYSAKNATASAIKKDPLAGLESRRTDEYHFTGVHSFEEAAEMALTGYDTGIKKLPFNPDELIERDGGISFNNNVVGAFPNVPNFCIGLPDTMVEIIDDTKLDVKPITVFVDAGMRGGIEMSTGIKLSKFVTEFLNELGAKADVRVFFVANWNITAKRTENGVNHMRLKVKDFGERLVLNKLAYAFHPSFYRVLTFALRESWRGCDYRGLGTSLAANNVAEDAMEDYNCNHLTYFVDGPNSTSLRSASTYKTFRSRCVTKLRD